MEGNWLGSWAGKWYGAGAETPEGSIAGSSSITVTASGIPSALAYILGAAGLTINGNGSLTSSGGEVSNPTLDLILAILTGRKVYDPETKLWHVFDANGIELVDTSGVLLQGLHGWLLREANQRKTTEVVVAWDTTQGVSPGWLKFEPVASVTVAVKGYGAKATTNSCEVETRALTEATLRPNFALCGTSAVGVQAYTTASVTGGGCSSGSTLLSVSAFVTFSVTGASAKSGSGKTSATGDAEANVGSYFAGGRALQFPDVVTVKNPTDEEMVLWFMRRNAIDHQPANV